MADITIQFDEIQLKALQVEMRGWPQGLIRAMYLSINDTTKQVRGQMASDLTKTINMKRRDIVPLISRTFAKATKLSANVHMKESARVGLEKFGGKQTKRGVTYKIKKRGKRERIASAFGLGMAGEKGSPPASVVLGHKVFRRVGKSRLPIVRLHGPSAAVAFIGEELDKKTEGDADKLLFNNLNRRVRFLLLKKAGKI